MQNSITSICDLDTLIYLVAYQNREEQDVDKVIYEVDLFMNTILTKTNCTYYLGFIGTDTNFRKDIYPEYKGKRPDKPEWLVKWNPIIRFRLIDYWKVVPVSMIEAEDALVISMEYYRDKTNCIAVYVDKDLDFIEGNRFNYQKHEFSYSDKLGELLYSKGKLKGKGLKFQYSQLIMGDMGTDNIPGLVGKGASFAYKLLDSCESEYSLFRRTYTAYLMYSEKEYIKKDFKLQWDLIVMLKEPMYGFITPNLIEYKKEEIDIFEL